MCVHLGDRFMHCHRCTCKTLHTLSARESWITLPPVSLSLPARHTLPVTHLTHTHTHYRIIHGHTHPRYRIWREIAGMHWRSLAHKRRWSRHRHWSEWRTRRTDVSKSVCIKERSYPMPIPIPGIPGIPPIPIPPIPPILFIPGIAPIPPIPYPI